ncbi:hypothetical protein N3K66_007435 [Trichothecium roseum]|uniref:Uncharacterized protein n=1 Tax=Trichothecium roseum TaxID=47278 RepID=A0ACC0UVM5_9HYPO|nr:hypothetical protein N3K66_007435 [Trichothecium roseum]
MGSAERIPTSWNEYDGRSSPSGSLRPGASGLNEESALLDDDGQDAYASGFEHRRSSVTDRLTAMADMGGVNSFRQFARSWQRATGFHEVIPRRQSFVYADSEQAVDDPATENLQYSRSYVEPRAPLPQAGLLRQHLQASRPGDSGAGEAGEGSAVSRASTSAGEDFRERESKALDAELANATLLPGGAPSSQSKSSIFGAPPPLATSSIIGSYSSYRGSLYGSIAQGSQIAPRRRSSGARLREGDEAEEEDTAHGEHEPILVKEVKQGSKVVLTVEGQSTLPQSVFNSINAIIGIGLLSLPLAFKMSGWVFGLLLLTLNASVTGYTAKLLSKCMDYDPSLITYSDLAFVSFGTRARIVVSALFSLELIAACVALVILFADSLDLLLPGLLTVNGWKVACAALVLLLNALPLRFLSYTSVIGIVSTFCIVVIVILDGLIKDHTPGSLWEPASTYILPSNWLALPLAYGLLASPWGAHSIFPSIYRDMRHPAKWGKAVKVTFSFSYVLDTCLAVIGILMFGDDIKDAITSNVLRTAGYPKAMTVLMCIFVAIIPLTKIPLNLRPLITTADVLAGTHESHSHEHNHSNQAATRRAALVIQITRFVIRTGVVLVLLLISIIFPAFDSVCAFLGAALCTLISIILPISFYLKLFWKDVSRKEATVLWLILAVFSVFGTVGTIWTFLPKDLVGA